MELHSQKFPETDPASYRGWMKAGMKDYLLEELKKLLLFVRVHQICGLEIGKIRIACFTPFGMKDLYNRKVWLYMNEIEAYNDGKVDEKALEEEWRLSGLKRPLPLDFDHDSEEWVLDENQQWRMVDSRGKYI